MTIWNPILTPNKSPRYVAIADAIEHDVRCGHLTPGDKLPTHRDLADHLGVTVGTVTRGYAEAARRGLLRGETGRGTYVGGETIKQPICHRENLPPGTIDLKVTLPYESYSPDISKALHRIANDSHVSDLLNYFPSQGRQVDREAGADWLTRYNLNTIPENIAVTIGGQNGLAVLLTALFRPGDSLAVEELTYPLIKTLAHRFHIKLLPVAMDESGMIPDALNEVCKSHAVTAIYLMPTCQNPTTARMPAFRRQEIAALTRRHDLLIIEDDAYALPAGETGMPLASLVPERTFFLASMSKSVAGGLRVAYLASPPDYRCTVNNALSDLVWMAPPLMAEIARQWIMDGTADTILHRKRSEAASRVQIAAKIFSGLDIFMQNTGYYAWLKLPDPWTAGDFVRLAEKNGVILPPDDIFVVGRRALPHAVRIALSGARTINDLTHSLQTMRTILSTQ